MSGIRQARLLILHNVGAVLRGMTERRTPCT